MACEELKATEREARNLYDEAWQNYFSAKRNFEERVPSQDGTFVLFNDDGAAQALLSALERATDQLNDAQDARVKTALRWAECMKAHMPS